MIRQAGPHDAADMAAFLERHIDTSMFLLSNLERFGTGERDHPHGTRFFLRDTGTGLSGVFGCTNGGFLMCQMPGLTAPEAGMLAHLVHGRTMRGMTGDAIQVARVLGALPLSADAFALNSVQPLYALDLARLAAPVADLRRPTGADRALLEQWYAASALETGQSVAARAEGDGRARAETALSAGWARLLFVDGVPVSLAGINARAGNAVQVGGVYTPPAFRGNGHAGRAVAACLAELRAGGAARAILFAASAAAARAYERIGFARIGEYRIAMLKAPVTLGVPA